MDEVKMNQDILEKLGLRQLNAEEITEVCNSYKSDLVSGLEGNESSLQMLKSCLSPTSLESLPEGREALVIEIGGTNLYSARVIIKDHKPVIISSFKTQFKKRIFSSSQEFFQIIVASLDGVIKNSRFDALAIVYSFAGKPTRTNNGVDVISSDKLTKEFVVPGIGKVGVGRKLVDTLNEFHPDLYTGQPVVVLNDTVATLFSNGADIGGVVGTGFNIALDTPKGIINSESGSFSGVPTYQIVNEIDRESLDPGNGLAEKQVSGVYLSKTFEKIIRILREVGISSKYSKQISSETITELLKYRGEDQEMLLLKEVASKLRDRSAQIVGMMIGTIFNTFPEIYKNEEERIPIEGSVFWQIPGYQEMVSEAIKVITEKKITFINVADAGRLGAAVAALGFL